MAKQIGATALQMPKTKKIIIFLETRCDEMRDDCSRSASRGHGSAFALKNETSCSLVLYVSEAEGGATRA